MTREAYIESRCRDLARERGWLLPKWTSPGNAGVPDRILLGPAGQIGFIEFKTPKGKTTKLQAAWARKLTVRGHHYAVVHSTAEFITFLESL